MNNEKKKIKKEAGEFYKKTVDRLLKNKFVLIIIAVGIVLLIFPWSSGGEDKKESPQAETPAENVEFSLKEQETKLAKILSAIDGAGDVSVMLTLKSSSEQILAQDEKTSDSEGENGSWESETTVSTVVVSAGNSQQSVVTLKYIYPEYQGAVVVAEGAGSATVRLAIMNAVSAATGLNTDKITVVKMK